MQVFKLIWKVIYKNKLSMIIYLAVFLFFASLAAASMSGDDNILEGSDTKVAIINHDSDTVLLNGLKDYLGKHAEMVSISSDKEAQQDALFFRKVEYIIEVPAGFSEGFMTGKEIALKKTTIPDASSGVFMDMLVNKYLNTAKAYLTNENNLSEQEFILAVNKDLAQETKVTFQSNTGENFDEIAASYFFNFFAYSILSILILGICSVMLILNKPELKMRTAASPLRLASSNAQTIIGYLSFALVAWFICILVCLIFHADVIFSKTGALFLMNSFVFTFAALSISVLVAHFVKSRNAMQAVSNIIALGSSFLGGVFVEQYLLGKTVLRIGSFTPSYWYVKSNDAIARLSGFQFEQLRPIFGNMLVMIGFGVAALAVTMVYSKQKRQAF